jgi:hypothetical protein
MSSRQIHSSWANCTAFEHAQLLLQPLRRRQHLQINVFATQILLVKVCGLARHNRLLSRSLALPLYCSPSLAPLTVFSRPHSVRLAARTSLTKRTPSVMQLIQQEGPLDTTRRTLRYNKKASTSLEPPRLCMRRLSRSVDVCACAPESRALDPYSP